MTVRSRNDKIREKFFSSLSLNEVFISLPKQNQRFYADPRLLSFVLALIEFDLYFALKLSFSLRLECLLFFSFFLTFSLRLISPPKRHAKSKYNT